MSALPRSIDETLQLLAHADYVAERSLATAVFLALKMSRPLFLEGEAGVGKTEIAKVLAGGLGRTMVRLQCYEGLDIASAVYEWNYSRQMIEIRLAETEGASRDAVAKDIFSERFLIKRPLMQALEGGKGTAPVLLIDELDRTDEPFEAYLLEVLSDFQITIPEIGTVRATEPPIVVLTSNRTREIHDAIKRRCFYHWVDYPDAARELEILKRKAPEASENLSREVVAFVQRLRKMDLFKLPGVAETIDWSKALVALDKMTLDPQTVNDTLGTLLKYQDDITRVRGSDAERLLAEVRAELSALTSASRRSASLPRTRVMSSWYLSRAPRVSLTVSVSSVILSRATSAFDQSIVSATPGSLNRSILRRRCTKATTSREMFSEASGALRLRISSSRAASG